MARKKTNLPEGYDKVFPTVLRGLMEDRGITQQMIADNIGKTRQAVGYYADGSSSPDWATLVRLAEFFDVSADYLLGLQPLPTKEDSDIFKATGFSQEAIAALRHIENEDTKSQVNRFLNDLMTDSDTLCSLAISYCMYKATQRLYNNDSDKGLTNFSGTLQYQKADGSVMKVPNTQAAKYMKMDLGYEFLNFVSKKD